MLRRSQRSPVTAAAVIAGLLVTGCASESAVQLPDGVTATVFQTRFDYGNHELEVRIANSSSAPITIDRAVLESSSFADRAEWSRPTVVPAGSARDLRVALPAPDCASVAPFALSLELEFSLSNGRTGRASVTPTDDLDQLPAIQATDCLAEAVGDAATITAVEPLEYVPGSREPARLTFELAASGGDGSVTIDAIEGTILLALVDDDGERIERAPVGIEIDGSTVPTRVTISVTPNRCDPHAVAEDRRGTFFPFVVSPRGGATATLPVAVGDELKAAIYEYIGEYCAA